MAFTGRCDPPEDPSMEAGEAVEGSQAQHTQQLAPQEALLGGELQGGTIKN